MIDLASLQPMAFDTPPEIVDPKSGKGAKGGKDGKDGKDEKEGKGG